MKISKQLAEIYIDAATAYIESLIQNSNINFELIQLDKLHQLDVSEIISRSTVETGGDWVIGSINFKLAKQLSMSPRQLADNVAKQPQWKSANTYKFIDKLEVANPGFINIWLNNAYYLSTFNEIDGNYGKNQNHIDINDQNQERKVFNKDHLAAKRIIVEYGHPNTHKLPHIGHLYSYIVGESLARLLEFAGIEIRRVNYQGDVGPHVAKAIWGWRKLGKQKPETLLEKTKLLQKSYQLGTQAFETDKNAKSEIQEINRKIYDTNSDIQQEWLETRQWSLNFYKQFEQLYGIEQVEHYLESKLWRKGKKSIEKSIGKVFKRSQGAIIFPGSEIGLHDRVFITKAETPTYECKEVGLNLQKYEDWEYDLTIIPTASEQNGYFSVVIPAIESVEAKLKGRIKHIGFGMVSLNTGKMSSRSGKILSAPDLTDEVISQIEKIVEKRAELSDNEKKDISKKVGLAAIRYTFLQGNILQNMTFDIDKSVSFEGNSGPYILYSYARIVSIVEQSSNKEKYASFLEYDPEQTASFEILNLSKEEMAAIQDSNSLNLLKLLERFPETVYAAQIGLSPHIVSNYCFELAQNFSRFYKENSINNAEDNDTASARLKLVVKTAFLLKNSLHLLGISTIKQM